MKKDELPQDMVDRLKREENAANPMVKLRDKIFGAEKPTQPKTEPAKKPEGEDVFIDDLGMYGTYRPATKEEIDGAIKRVKDRKSKGMKKGGKVSSASKRADGCAIRGKTRA